MEFSDYLKEEWVPTMGCTEPASIALSACIARSRLDGDAEDVYLVVDPRMYKNCYAIGIPNSGHKTGIVWSAAIGACLKDPLKGLECFGSLTKDALARAGRLVEKGLVHVDVDKEKNSLFVDCRLEARGGSSRAVIEGTHTNVVLIEKDGKAEEAHGKKAAVKQDVRAIVAGMSIGDMINMAKGIGAAERELLRKGMELNRKIARHGLSLFPKKFVELSGKDSQSKMSTLVCAGVYARMWGEEFTVMSLAGSGNKGIVALVPLTVADEDFDSSKVEEALALACLVTSATTHYLGSLSAVCGCSNAAGIGLSAGLVLLSEGGAKEIELAIHNMVGNVTGMICDGAKIGCALKTMTAVDSALRASTLAMNGIGIPPEDGIVGETGLESLKNLGRIATTGMFSADAEILAIMQEKIFSSKKFKKS